MTANVASTIAALAASTWLILGLSTVGAAVRVLLPGPALPFAGLSTSTGQGAAVSMAVTALAWRATGSVRMGLAALVALVLIAASWTAIMIVRRASRRDMDCGARWTQSQRESATINTWALGLAFAAVLVPLLRYGWASWIPHPDLPSYVGSAYYWQDPVGFAATHEDDFGQGIMWRAQFEKPMVTGLFLLADALGIPPWLAFPPLMVSSVFILVGSMSTVIARILHVSASVSLASVAIATFSVVALSRVYQASIGHVVAAALCATLLATFIGHSSVWPNIALSGTIAAAAFGSNLTLMLGFAPTLATVALWADGRLGVPVRDYLTRLGWSLFVAIVILLPLTSGLRTSLSIQSTGEQGEPVPLTTPLALLGLQPSLNHSLTTAWVVAMWVVALSAALFLRRACGAQPLSNRSLLLMAATIGTSTMLAVRFGPNNYSVLKMTTLQIWIVMPCAFAAASTWPARPELSVHAIRTLAAVSLSIGMLYPLRWSQTVVHGADFQDAALAALPALNVSLRNNRDSSFAGVTVAPGAITVTNRTYWAPAPPGPGPFLVRLDEKLDRSWGSITPLTTSYGLAELPTGFDQGRIEFSPANALAGAILFGDWDKDAISGVWDLSRHASVALTVGEELRGSAVELVIRGRYRPAPGREAAEVVRIAGKDVGDFPVTNEIGTMVLRVMPESYDLASGRLSVEFVNPIAPAWARTSGADRKGFTLESVEIRRVRQHTAPNPE